MPVPPRFVIVPKGAHPWVDEVMEDARVRAGRVRVVGMDGIRPMLEAIKAGVLESSVARIPGLQGSMSVLMLWQASPGVRLPRTIDTGSDVITQDNVDRHLAGAG